MTTQMKRGGAGAYTPDSDALDLTVSQMERIRKGLEALRLWLYDLIEGGLAAARPQPTAYWDEIGARLVDSDLPELALNVRGLQALINTGEDWAETVLERLARLYLMIAGLGHFDQLSPSQRGDLRIALGCLPQLDSIPKAYRVRDCWHVIGYHTTREQASSRSIPDWLDENIVHLHCTWLWGEKTRRTALTTARAWRTKDQRFGLTPGASFEGDLAFYPSAYPLRGSFYGLEIEKIIPGMGLIPFGRMQPCSFTQMLDEYAEALGRNPFLERFPALLTGALPARNGKLWAIRDGGEGIILPLVRGWKFNWDLIAISGGAPFTIFGEWDGKAFLPLSAWANERVVSWS